MIGFKNFSRIVLFVLLAPSIIKASFEGSTLVNTPYGMKTIASLKKNDLVLSYNTENNEIVPVKITKKIERHVEQPIVITFKNNEETFITSSDQLLYYLQMETNGCAILYNITPLSMQELSVLLSQKTNLPSFLNDCINKVLSLSSNSSKEVIQQWNAIKEIGHLEEEDLLHAIEVEYPHTFLIGKSNFVATSKKPFNCPIM